MKKENGITLIALVISIIVLIILAGVAINTLINNGIIDKAKTATQEYKNAQDYEETQIAKYTNEIDSQVNGNRGNVSISEEEYNKLKNKGKYDLLTKKSKTELSSLTDNKYIINNIDLNKYSEIALYSIYDNEILSSTTISLERFKTATSLGTIWYWGSYIATKAFYINDTSAAVQILSTSSATDVELYGIY